MHKINFFFSPSPFKQSTKHTTHIHTIVRACVILYIWLHLYLHLVYNIVNTDIFNSTHRLYINIWLFCIVADTHILRALLSNCYIHFNKQYWISCQCRINERVLRVYLKGQSGWSILNCVYILFILSSYILNSFVGVRLWISSCVFNDD